MELPKALVPVAEERFTLADGRVIRVPKARPVFKKWKGVPPSDSFGGKPFLDHAGEPCFAELVVLRLFLDAGWSGRWVETYGAAAMRPRLLLAWGTEGLKKQVNHPIESPLIAGMLDCVAKANKNTYSGCWDVVAWHGSQVVFVEAKLNRLDKLTDTQRRWFSAGIKAGFAPESFLVVEWSSE